MLMYPSVRKGLITEPTSAPFINQQDTVCIQDDQFIPDFSQEPSLQCYYQQQPRLQSPFQYHPSFDFVSPPSSAPSSPFSSPASSFSHLPATAVADYSPVAYDGSSFEAPSMTPVSSYNPSIQIQHSASPPNSNLYLQQYQQPQYLYSNHHHNDSTSMLAQHTVTNNHGWDGNLQLLSPARIPNGLPRHAYQDSQLHTSPASTKSAPGGSVQRSNNGTLSKPLPTPVQTPIQNSFLATPFQNYDPSAHDARQAEAEAAMRQAMMEQQQQQQHPRQSSDHSLAPSVSTVSHNSPVTPQTSFDEIDDASKAMANGENRFPDVDRWMDEYLRADALSDYGNQNGNNLTTGIPKLNRTISDIYQDELYNPAIIPTPQVPKQPSNNNSHQQQQHHLLNPYRNVFADRLQAANQGHLSARSQSPAVNLNRDRSPFRQNSPLAAEFSGAALQQPQLATSVPMTQNVMNLGPVQTEPKTMSPKDAVLDFSEAEDAAMPPLFSSSQPDFNLSDALGLRRESSSSLRQTQNFPSMDSFSQYTTQTGTVPQQYQFAPQPQNHRQSQQQQQQQAQNTLLHHTPEFPASLPHLESTGSDIIHNDMTSPQSNMTLLPIKDEITRPSDTSTDGGTYTCTYHGCTMRFETPAKLQKHKREAHRQTTPGGHLVGRDHSARNSQAGPHKCERINPSTGKPCNSVFSRPYDLTRHEDTIHNARKQKVRCHLCREEKTFSRNDALTRHMRVVHPEVDWPGKQRRRGRE
ncbi:stress-regulated transcription factor RPN4 [Aspergillus clavatus NRRL 1]|uniref:C2H2 transcription factor (Rpn4), putative n=1 Tax=Aspergillus clavatus (strain ATCC 1007 / CBS 513.65 / DSM 816 / NCTC 3887 / NRRL 1 / QM 1276 / 107) TaxID=344612 RepID=A1CP83_ASPCL|nr:C2H2 transcription factor (Rpn4), putative [Aspergillus clavatus NRRL 1]EAW07454.1 C2H2 transcription factor (Rpn4), putative [Aspergillus clavatus NRRL 1]